MRLLLDVCRTAHSTVLTAMQRAEQVQRAAVDLVEGLTGSVDGLEQLMTQADVLLRALLRLIAGDAGTSKAALHSLINLSQVTGRLQRPCSALESADTISPAQLC